MPSKLSYQSNPDKYRAQSRARYYVKMRDADFRIREALRKRACRAINKYNKYGLTNEAWEELFNSQNRACAICESKHPRSVKNYWHTDHNHSTGAVRGILCQKCNLMLGHADDDIVCLESAIGYLKRP